MSSDCSRFQVLRLSSCIPLTGPFASGLTSLVNVVGSNLTAPLWKCARLAGSLDRDSLWLDLRRLGHANGQNAVVESSGDVRRVDLLGQLQLAAPVTPMVALGE
jgi:hypothetical protein